MVQRAEIPPQVEPAAPPSVRGQGLPCRNSHFAESGLPSRSGFIPRRSVLDTLHSTFHIYAATYSITASSSLLVQSRHRPSQIESLQICSRYVHKQIHRKTRITVALAVQILRDTLAKTANGRVDTVPVRLALRRLWAHCPERWPLVMFWEGAQQDNEISRSQSVAA